MGTSRTRVLAAVLALCTAHCASAPPPAAASATASDEASLRAVDQQQRTAVFARDVAAMDALAHPNLRVNAPNNRVVTREQLLSMMASGEIAAEAFEREAEVLTITGNIGVVMGHETFTPVATSEQGRLHGARQLLRRYTNVYLREAGGWRLLARHANVIPEATRPQAPR